MATSNSANVGVLLWLGTMGFEQLAALKEQLARQAKAAPRAKTRRAPPEGFGPPSDAP